MQAAKEGPRRRCPPFFCCQRKGRCRYWSAGISLSASSLLVSPGEGVRGAEWDTEGIPWATIPSTTGGSGSPGVATPTTPGGNLKPRETWKLQARPTVMQGERSRALRHLLNTNLSFWQKCSDMEHRKSLQSWRAAAISWYQMTPVLRQAGSLRSHPENRYQVYLQWKPPEAL